jgi:hypothetical protein
MKNTDIRYTDAYGQNYRANEMRYSTAFQQGLRDAMQHKPSVKPFGDVARAGYSAGYNAGLMSLIEG